MGYLDELRAINDKRDEIDRKYARIQQERGVPDDVPIVWVEGDSELAELHSEHLAVEREWDAFQAKYWAEGAPEPNP